MPQLYITGEKASSTQSIGGRLRERGFRANLNTVVTNRKICYCCELMMNLEFNEISKYDLDVQYTKW